MTRLHGEVIGMAVIQAALALLVVGIGIYASVLASRAAQKRREDLLLLAQRLGFDFYNFGPDPLSSRRKSTGFFGTYQGGSGNPDRFVARFEGFQPFGIGHSPVIGPLICGRRGDRDWYLFDYQYKTTQHNGKTTQTVTHNNSVVAVRLPIVFPQLELDPETVFHRIGNKFGMKELTFELEEFNRRYFIKSNDPRVSHDFLHPKAIEYLMRQSVRKWQFVGTIVLLYQPTRWSASEFDRAMQEIEGFVDLIPRYVHEDRGFAATWTSPLD